jgi:hypothetical protein
LSSKAYSPRVAGVYSTRAALIGRPFEELEDARIDDLIPMAIVGIVPCKVTAENGAIKIGDLLVTANRPGYAMKGTKRSKMLGAVVGKAMQPLPKGTGVIEVLVTLQ